MRTLLIACLIALAAVGGWTLLTLRPTPVTVSEVTRGRAAEIVYATGVVEPEHWAKVTPLVRGRIVESCDCEGAHVEQGEMLFRLDDTEIRAHADELGALLALAEKELVRSADLYERGIATRERYDRDLAEVARLTASLAAARSQIVDMELRAPLAGQVLRIEGDVGEVASLGDGLAWVGQPRPLLVIAEVNEEDIPLVAVGQSALLKADAFPDMALDATVDSITPMGDPTLKTYRVRLALPDDAPLLIGMTVDVNIVARTVEDALLVPVAALIDGGLQVVDGDGRLRFAPVRLGLSGAETAQILDGPGEGALIVSPAVDGLADGARVAPVRP